MSRNRRALRALAAAAAAMCALATHHAATAHGAERFDNHAAIKIPLKGAATPFPSTINVQGQAGRITYVGVELRKVRHTRISDLTVVLEAPDGTRSVVMSDVCGGINQPPVNSFVFSPQATTRMPATGPCSGGLYLPTDRGDADGIPDFDRFLGANPNGTWKLYVVDERTGYLGAFDGGWSLTLESSVPDTSVPATGTIGTAGTYPLTRQVTGLSGVITDVNVSQYGVFHSRPDDLDLVLVGPGGQKVTLMSDACGNVRARQANWAWDDEAAAPMSNEGPCPSDTRYRPTEHDVDEIMDSPAPPGPYEKRLSAFDLTSPAGEWKLYATDDLIGAAGFFLQRFQLEIATRPAAALSFAESAYVGTEGQTRELTLTRSAGGGPLGAARVAIRTQAGTATEGADYRPINELVDFAPGQATRTVPITTLADGVSEEPESFSVTIESASGDAAPQPPRAAVVTIREPGQTGGPIVVGGGGAGGGGAGGGNVDQGNGPIGQGAPVLSGLTVTPRRFALARRSRARRASRGTTIRWRLSEAGTVALAFERVLPGRRAGGACRAPSTRNRRGRRCTRYVAVGTLGVAGRVGANRLAFRGLVGDRRLRPGTYRVRVTATDASGNRSARRSSTFRVTG